MFKVTQETSAQWSYTAVQFVVRSADGALHGRYNSRRVAEYVAARLVR